MPLDNTLEFSYTFVGGNQIQHDKVKKATLVWQAYANILFKPVENRDGADICITFNDDDYHSLSKDARANVIVNLNSIGKTDEALTNDEKTCILHELGHALGAMHDHQSSAGSKLGSKKDDVLEYYKNSTPARIEEILSVYAPNPAPAPAASTSPFILALTAELSKYFPPPPGQVFALQFPGRVLSQGEYVWDTDRASLYGSFLKPAVVNESEFRLVDQLYDIKPVVDGPNGRNLSAVYEQCLNNLVPAVDLSARSKEQERIRKWLLWKEKENDPEPTRWVDNDPIPSQHPTEKARVSTPRAGGSTSKLSRIELAEALMQEYLAEKLKWEAERDEIIKKERGAQPVSEDIKSPAEALQDVKMSLRESAMSSLDGSTKIYPVRIQPIDWFKGLSTSFTVEDLTATPTPTPDPELIAQTIDAKTKALEVLRGQLAAIQKAPSADKLEIEAAQGQVDAAQSGYDTASAKLSSAYPQNIITLAATCMDASGKFSMASFQKAAARAGIAKGDFVGIGADMKAVNDARVIVTNVSRAYSKLISPRAMAEALGSGKEEADKIISDIAVTEKEIKEFDAARLEQPGLPLQGATDPKDLPSLDSFPTLPEDKGTEAGKSQWREVVMTHEVDDCTLFYGSSLNHGEAAAAMTAASGGAPSFTTQIGFRCTQVTVDRGEWFQPQFFKRSEVFYHTDEKTTWSRWPESVAAKSVEDLRSGDMKVLSEEMKGGCLMPAYPSGFLVCKDITIKVHMSESAVRSGDGGASSLAKMAASSSRILCWSSSTNPPDSSSSPLPSKSYSFTQAKDGCVIRIPGPQILGYMLQITAPDRSAQMPEKSDGGFLAV